MIVPEQIDEFFMRENGVGMRRTAADQQKTEDCNRARDERSELACWKDMRELNSLSIVLTFYRSGHVAQTSCCNSAGYFFVRCPLGKRRCTQLWPDLDWCADRNSFQTSSISSSVTAMQPSVQSKSRWRAPTQPFPLGSP